MSPTAVAEPTAGPAVETAQPLLGWLAAQTWSAFATDLVAQARSGRALSERQVAAAERMRAKVAARPAEPAEPVEAVTEAGIYRAGDGRLIRAKVSQAGNLYGLVLDLDTRSWAYAPGVLRQVTPADRLTVEQATAHGLTHGWCCVCGKELTAEKSVAAGIGPVCARRL